MNEQLLEHYFETVILPLYKGAVDIAAVKWKDHGKVGQDTWAHYFEDENGREYVLLYEDFPGNEYLADDMTHEIVMLDGETSVQVMTKPETTLDNLTGYFTLYREK